MSSTTCVQLIVVQPGNILLQLAFQISGTGCIDFVAPAASITSKFEVLGQIVRQGLYGQHNSPFGSEYEMGDDLFR